MTAVESPPAAFGRGVLKLKAAAKYAGVSVDTLRRMVRSRRIAHTVVAKSILIPVAELDRLLAVNFKPARAADSDVSPDDMTAGPTLAVGADARSATDRASAIRIS